MLGQSLPDSNEVNGFLAHGVIQHTNIELLDLPCMEAPFPPLAHPETIIALYKDF